MIRELTAAEAATAIEWAAAEGWNPGHGDLPCYRAQDPGLFLGNFVAGRLASVISATRYGADFGFIGFYIAKPEVRGQGHGIAVWQAAMARLEGRLVGLDGVVAQQDNYRKSGFVLAFNNIRFGGVPQALPRDQAMLVPINEVPRAALHALDATVFPAPREAFWDAWLTAPRHVGRALLRDGRLAGFGVIRPCRTGHRIGPLVADDEAGARSLLAALIAEAPGEVFLDVPEPHGAAVALAQSLGLRPVFEAARMYTGAAPPIAMSSLWGITSFELG